MATTDGRVLTDLSARLAAHGLLCLGAFAPAPEDNAPAGTRTMVLVGNAGPDMWHAFDRERRDEPDPLDSWTRRTIDPIAEAFGARALYPFAGPPYPPIQRWAARAGQAFPSPLGLMIHATYGLWHAYRAALAFATEIAVPAAAAASPCATCADKPCLSACPVGAFTATGYDSGACRTHLAAPDGADCMETGCRARRACPAGQDYRYAPEQALFHMTRFRESSVR